MASNTSNCASNSPKCIGAEPKNAYERKEWDRMSDRMNAFHNHFRHSFARIYKLADCYDTQGKSSLSDYLQEAASFHDHLNTHHGIEEQYIFPVLALKMPEFKSDAEHLQQHKQIHAGLDKYDEYIKVCLQRPAEYKPEELRSIMNSFSTVLFLHLDEEVQTLRGENLRRYYTLEEVRRLPM